MSKKIVKWERLFDGMRPRLTGLPGAWFDELLTEAREMYPAEYVMPGNLKTALCALGWDRRLTVYSANAPRERWGRQP